MACLPIRIPRDARGTRPGAARAWLAGEIMSWLAMGLIAIGLCFMLGDFIAAALEVFGSMDCDRM